MQATVPAGPVLVVTDDCALIEQLLRLCAAAAVNAEVVSDPEGARRLWRTAAGVLVGADAAVALADSGLPRRDGVVLVSAEPASASLWQRALAIRAEHVAVLPDGATDLAGRISDYLDGAASSCLTLGTVAARGGGGASILTAALALTAARNGVPTLLIDADSMAGGIDLVVGCEGATGLRWPEVAASSGRVSAAALRCALPTVDELSVLSWDRGVPASVEPATMRSIVTAGQRGARLVIVDLPRRLDGAATEAAECCDVLVLLCPTDVRAIAGATRLVFGLREVVSDIRLVVRPVPHSPARPDTIARMLSLPLLGSVPTKTAIARSVDDGLGIPSRGSYAAACQLLLEELGVLGRHS